MVDIKITCISKINHDNPYEGITHLGGSNWKWTKSEVIAAIENRTHAFYTKINDKRADVYVVKGSNGRYLRTYADSYCNDNLLALPACY